MTTVFTCPFPLICITPPVCLQCVCKYLKHETSCCLLRTVKLFKKREKQNGLAQTTGSLTNNEILSIFVRAGMRRHCLEEG